MSALRPRGQASDGKVGVRLSARHRADLRRSGLSDESAAAAGLRSLSDAEAQALLGRDDVGSGMAIPYPGCAFRNGRPYTRLRLDVPLVTGGDRVRYLTKRGERKHLYVPPILPSHVLSDVSIPLAVTEGEKKALKACQERIWCIGLPGVWCWKTRAGGESAPLPDLDTVAWSGRLVAIVFDSDITSKASVRSARSGLARELARRGARVRLPELPPGPDGEKVGLDDYLIAHSREEFEAMANVGRGRGAHAGPTDGASAAAHADWPEPPSPEAFHGLVGEFVRLIEPHTEADPVALLLSYFVAYGNVIGRGPHFMADGARHCMNLNVALVGRTARGRKGSSWARVRRSLETVDPAWASVCVQSGLSSGEGLIWAVRDPVEKQEPVRERTRGPIVSYRTVIDDPGVSDKRLLIVQEEFASTLRVMGRDGSTLSATIRHAWDSGDLRILTRNSPAKATGAHISIIGHITRDEVLRYLDATETANGFANRFLWACVERSKLLPDGGHLDEGDLVPCLDRLKAAVGFARGVGLMERDAGASALWHRVYPDLSRDVSGMLGAVLARAEAQTMRLACLYALLDRSAVVRSEHLEAALALWGYCEDSARFIFGDALGDPVADTILRALRQAANGLTRTEISGLFGRNVSASRISHALALLQDAGLAQYQQDAAEAGRPAERWYATRPTCRPSAYERNE